MAGRTARSCGIERYLHWRPEKGRWWFRRRVSGDLVAIIGKAEWRQTPAARSRPEAEREAMRLLDETNWTIDLALAGNWPPVGGLSSATSSSLFCGRNGQNPYTSAVRRSSARTTVDSLVYSII